MPGSRSRTESRSFMPRFVIGETDFLLDGEPFRILSGAMHYFRVHPGSWRNRIRSAKLMGLNTIETYVAWNAHSPVEGEFSTQGELDIQRFLRIVAEEGMFAIVRPGPFICAEWHNGGLPGWLTHRCGEAIRRNAPDYMSAVERYFAQVLPLLAPLQVDERGPLILMQVENEYGAYGSDASYLQALADLLRTHGITVPLTTIDQPTNEMLSAGGLPWLHKTASFGSGAQQRLATLRAHQKTGPLMCAEFWDGWFDHWGGRHATTDAQASADELDQILASGASVNIYMAHGGTNWGLTNGANHKGYYEPTVTSYDYDAPISESGELTAKFYAFRDVLGKYVELPPVDEKLLRKPSSPDFVADFTRSCALRDVVDSVTPPMTKAAVTTATDVPTFDEVGLFGGFGWYRTTISGDGGVLEFGEVRDRAQVFVDGHPVAVLEREHNDRRVLLPRVGRGGGRAVLEVLVEDQGRVNYGPRIGESKGLIGPVRFNGETLTGWHLTPIDLADPGRWMNGATTADEFIEGPVFRSATFALDEPTDLFLSTREFGKGVAWVNGWPLGRFWSRGPQHTLYVPGPATTRGQNTLVVLELAGTINDQARFVAGPDLGPEES
jgi:beta-galactosidase